MSLRTLFVACAAASVVAPGPEAEYPVLRGTYRLPTAQELEHRFLELLEVSGGAGGTLDPDLESIEASLATSYQALPKNEFGRVSSRAVHHLIHSHFIREHGWLIKGLEPRGFQPNASEERGALVLHDSIPGSLKELLEKRRSGRGFTLRDVVALTALLERLVLEQATNLLHVAYDFAKVPTTTPVDEETLHSVLTSFMILVRQPSIDPEEHGFWVEDIQNKVLAADSFVMKAVEFERDAVLGSKYERGGRANPFQPLFWPFKEVTRLAGQLLKGYGKFQNEECRAMKHSLANLAELGSGLVPLHRFYGAAGLAGSSAATGVEPYGFRESAAYLREVGALDESLPGRPRLRIANYVLGPTNCVANSQYFSICCLDDCKLLMSEIEAAVKAPTASPEQLFDIVGNLSVGIVDGPAELSAELRIRLDQIAAHHQGEVPLHGRLFAQWLHWSFPAECPYPHHSSMENSSQVDFWGTDRHVASQEEITGHLLAAPAAVAAEQSEAAEPCSVGEAPEEGAWTDEEVLPLHEHGSGPSGGLGLRLLLRSVLPMAMLGMVTRFAYGGLRSARAALQIGRPVPRWKAGASVLPMPF